MSAKYLLPCRCGQQIAIEPRQAGETTVCACGQSLPIPPMSEIVALEPAIEEVSLPTKPVWRWQHGLLVLGVVLLVAAVGLAGWFRSNRPIAAIDTIAPEHIRQTAKDLTPLQTWQYWELMKQGMDRRTDQVYAAKMTIYEIEQAFAGVLALSGIVLVGLGVALKKKS